MPTLLWIASGVLAAMMLIAGLTKSLQTKEKLYQSGLTYVEDLPAGLVRALGVAEVLGAIGLVVPGLVGVAPALVPIAALCVGVTMAGAVLVHARRSEWDKVLMPAALLVLAALVAWGRFGPWPL